MRTLAIALIAAFVFLLSQQLTTADDRRDREERGHSQAVVTGSLLCDPVSTGAALNTFGGLGVLAIPTTSFNVFIDHDEDCLDLLPALAEQVPHRICEFSDPFENGNLLQVEFVCTGRADAVISAIGKMAKAVIRLGQT
jgi:hypothetical protein